MQDRAIEEELAQSKVRLYIIAAVLTYMLGVDLYHGQFTPEVYLIGGLALLYAGAVFVLVRRYPGDYPVRHYINIVVDVGLGSIMVYLFGEAAAIVYPIYLWTIIAYGLRFGLSYLYAAIVAGAIGFSLVVFNGSYWIENRYTAVGLLLGIIILPLFFAVLIRRLQQGQEELKIALEAAESANIAKDDFLASMSHELRTPLTSIIGNSQYLKEQNLNRDSKAVLEDIESAGQSQLALVNDILDMSKIDSGKFTIEEIPFDFDAFLQNVESMLSIRADDMGLALIFDQTNREENLLIGDEQRIGQILINLIGNAIKFTNRGKVSLTTLVEGNNLIYKVEDSGIGMSEETLGRLFQRFEQADRSTTRRFGGSGLGLFISMNLAEMMGGTIEVSSQEGVGSLFKVILPYRPSDIPVKSKNVEHEKESDQGKKLSGHVLIAEDTPELQLLERRILEGMGLTVTIANDGREAVDLALTESFDLILMDMQMPEIDGIEATIILRSKGNQVPIIALTANVMQKHRDLFGEAGCDAFLSKPIDKVELRRVLEQYL